MSIFPYVYYMIRSFEITSDDRQIAVYAGMVTSAFAFAEFSTGVIWGRLSDKVGRKPILISGLAGTALSMLVFGFAPSLPVALLGRALGGLLNGYRSSPSAPMLQRACQLTVRSRNVGVLQTTVAEIVTVKEHQRRSDPHIQDSIIDLLQLVLTRSCLLSGALGRSTYMFQRTAGELTFRRSILGPALGGALAQPCVSYPNWFASGTLFDRFPFLLPNLVCAVILAIGVLIGILFLEETHERKRTRRDVGLEVGRWMLNRFRRQTEPPSFEKADEANVEEVRSLLEDDLPPGYSTREGSPRSNLSRAQSPAVGCIDFKTRCEKRIESKPHGVRQAFTKQVILNIIGYGLLA